MDISIFYEYLAAILRSARATTKLTQAEVASRAGVTRRYIQLLENGKQEATLSTFFAVAHALSLPPSQLVADLESSIKNECLPAHVSQHLRPYKIGRPSKRKDSNIPKGDE